MSCFGQCRIDLFVKYNSSLIMARPKKESSQEAPIIENKEVEMENTEKVASKVESNNSKNLILCIVLIPFTEKQEFGGKSYEKGDEISLNNERLKNALDGRLVIIKK